MVAANSIRCDGECLPDCRVVEISTLDHVLGGEVHDESVCEVVHYPARSTKRP